MAAGALSFSEQRLSLSETVWAQLFEVVLTPIVVQLVRLATASASVRWLLLCGGLSASNYVRSRLMRCLGVGSAHRLRIVCARRPMLCVVVGAALFSKNQCFVRSRRLRSTVGIEVGQSVAALAAQSGVEAAELRRRLQREGRELRRSSDDAQLMVEQVFHALVESGDELQIDDAPKVHFVRPVDAEADEIEIKLFELQRGVERAEGELLFTDDARCTLLASKRLKLRAEWPRTHGIPIAFFFGDTAIRVFVGVDGLDQSEAQIELEYHYE